MHSFIVAMIKRFRPQLAVIVGHPAMIGTGPLGGHAVETGLVIASTDPVAADTVGAHLLGFKPQAVGHLWEASRWRLGETDRETIKFLALNLEQAVQLFTRAAYGPSSRSRRVLPALRWMKSRRLRTAGAAPLAVAKWLPPEHNRGSLDRAT
jgi:hypothetical protein